MVSLAITTLRFRSGQASGSAPLSITPKRSEEHTSELQSRLHLVFRLLLEKKNGDPAVRFFARQPRRCAARSGKDSSALAPIPLGAVDGGGVSGPGQGSRTGYPAEVPSART